MVETPIARRMFELTRADGTKSEVCVEIGLPHRWRPGALERTLIEIGRLLAETPEVSDGRVEWPGGAADELGFPTALAKARV